MKEKKIWSVNGLTYREVLGNVGDFFLSFLGNPKAPNFSQSFLHFYILFFFFLYSVTLLKPLTEPDKSEEKKEEEEEEVSTFVCTHKNNSAKSLFLSLQHMDLSFKLTTHVIHTPSNTYHIPYMIQVPELHHPKKKKKKINNNNRGKFK